MLSFELRCKGKKLSKMLFCKNRQFSENTLFFSMFSAKTPQFFRKPPEFFTHFPENNPQFSQNGKIFTFPAFALFYSVNVLILSQTALQRKAPHTRCAPPARRGHCYFPNDLLLQSPEYFISLRAIWTTLILISK